MPKFHKTHHKLHQKAQEACCPELILKHHFKRYHRFFIFSPLFLLLLVALLFAMNGENPAHWTPLAIQILLGIIFFKEIASFGLSRKIYGRILLPIEKLKEGVYEVTHGNYDVEITTPAAPEISELISAFNQMSTRLRESEALKLKYETNRKELIASISHDLKTPITAINGFTDGILDGVADSPEKREAYIRIIQQNARYMNRLIDDLLLYSKLDLHKLNFEFSPLPFGSYVSEVFSELKLENEENGIAMELNRFFDSDITLPLDSRHFTRAIRNIVANALTHGHSEAPKIIFDIAQSPEGIHLCIEDNGPGVGDNQLPHLFDRFYRADCSRNSASGSSGLGLAIAREIVQAHQGTISAENGPKGGLRICIHIPTLREEPHA